WNTIVEEMVTKVPLVSYQGYAGKGSAITRMTDITLQETERLSSGSAELDRVLGGGIIMGSAILIGGNPGIGKSTILLQVISHLSQHLKALYITGEESPQQVTLRAKRLGLPEDHLWLL